MRSKSSLIAFTLVAAACGRPTEPVQGSKISGFFDSEEVKWDKRVLSVCWEQDSRSNRSLARYKHLIHHTVTSQYLRAGFLFTGWDSCQDSEGADIRVWVDPKVWPNVQAFGKDLANLSRGLQLTFDFTSAGEDGWGRVCQQDEYADNCIRNYALHEFGHSLGLKHEADRDDSNCNQTTDSSGIKVGDYDPDSIMNYCHNESEVEANRRPALSYNDLATLEEIYHRGDQKSEFASIAWSRETGAYGTSSQWIDRDAARHTALGYCKQFAGASNDCRTVVTARNACAAFARGPSHGYGWAVDLDREKAERKALRYCHGHGGACQILASVCSDS